MRPVECSISNLALTFLCKKALVDSTIQAAFTPSFEYPGYSTHFPRRTTGLHLTARYGLLYLTQRFLVSGYSNRNIEADLEDGEGRTPLSYAAERGYEQVVKLLLDKGADVNAQGRPYGNALQAASARGHKQVVKLLLDKGADVNTQGRPYGNALCAASNHGHKQVVKLLLDKGADVNTQGGAYSNALQAASDGGHEQVVKLLLDKGADVNAQGGVYSNALQAASERGHEQVVKLLCEARRLLSIKFEAEIT
jgi:ankyrin repeat protein